MSDGFDPPIAGGEDEVGPPPITFWIMIGLAVLYLAWRLVQGISWVVSRLI